jgi:hypothetical protein
MQLGVSESVEVTGVTPILQTQDAVVARGLRRHDQELAAERAQLLPALAAAARRR